MKKLTFLTFLVALLFAGPLSAQSPSMGQVATVDDISEPSGFLDCFTLDVTFPNQFPELLDVTIQSGGVGSYSRVINKDCLDDLEWKVEMISNGDCYSGYGIGYSFDNIVTVEFADETLVTYHPPNFPQNKVFSGLLSEIDMSNLVTPRTYDFRVVNTYYTSGQPVRRTELATITVLVLSDYQDFVVRTQTGDGTITICDEDDLPVELTQWAVCNEGNAQGTLSWTINQAYEVSNKLVTQVSLSWSGEGSQSISETLNHKLTAGAGITYNYNFSEIENTSSQGSIGIDMTYDPAGCVHPGLDYHGRETETRVMQVVCTSLHPNGDAVYNFEITRITLHRCVGFDNETTNCAPEAHEIIQNQRFANTPNSRPSQSECTFDLTVVQSPDADYLEFYRWTGPDGFEAFGPTVEGVPIGHYTLEITSQCGNMETLDVIVCPTPSNGPWEYQEETGYYCRTVNCESNDCGSFTTDECFEPAYTDWIYNAENNKFCRTVLCPSEGGCHGFIPFEECVSPTYGSWSFNTDLMVCERDILLNGQPSGMTDTAEPTITFDYDDFSEVCLKIYTCEGEEHTIEADPTYGEWGYDDFWEECYREVICFGDQTDDDWVEENNDPVTVWEYDDFWDECIGRVYCEDEFDDDGEGDLQFEGSPVYNWDFVQEGLYQCVAMVSCEYEGTVYETSENITEDGEWVDSEIVFDDDFYFCDLTVECGDGEYTETSISTQVTIYDTFINPEGVEMCDIGCNLYYQGTITVPCNLLSPYMDEQSYLRFTLSEFEQWKEAVTEQGIFAPRISPNPFREQVFLEGLPIRKEGWQLAFVDVLGQAVQVEALPSGASHQEVSTTALLPGVYFLVIYDENKQVIHQEKILKLD